MGTWSAEILGNDTSCEVRERFLELYDSGENPNNIANIVLEEQQENMQYDRTNVWTGLALACWECKVLTPEILDEIKKIVEKGEDIAASKELEADNSFLKKRQIVLNKFLIKISKEKEKARLIKKAPKQVETVYSAGMCLAYQKKNNEYVGIYIAKSEHFRNRGEIRFFFMDFATNQLPTLKMFRNSKLYGLKKLEAEWGNYDYNGNETGIFYEKATKDDFFNNIPKILHLIGQLAAPDENKLINNFFGHFMDLSDSDSVIEVLENIRKSMIEKHKLSDITLEQLLEKTGIIL